MTKGVKAQSKEKSMAQSSSSIGGICPFSWICTTKAPGCLGGLLGAKAQDVWEPQQCMGARCQLWDSRNANCGLITRNTNP